MSSTDFASRAPKGSPNTKGNGSTDLRCVVFLGSPYGANPSTAGLWESAPKGRGGVFADTLNVCPRRRAPRHGWRGRAAGGPRPPSAAPRRARPGYPGAEVSRQGRRECRVRSARAPKPEERRVRLRHPLPAGRQGGGLSFGDFSLAAQRKVTCRGSATHKYTPPEGRLDPSHRHASAHLMQDRHDE